VYHRLTSAYTDRRRPQHKLRVTHTEHLELHLAYSVKFLRLLTEFTSILFHSCILEHTVPHGAQRLANGSEEVDPSVEVRSWNRQWKR